MSFVWSSYRWPSPCCLTHTKKKSHSPLSSTARASDNTSTSTDSNKPCHKKRRSKVPRYDIQVMLAIHQDEGPNQTKAPSFPKEVMVEFDRGFHFMETFYEQVKLLMQVHIPTSDEFMEMSKTHKIMLKDPQFKYRTDRKARKERTHTFTINPS